jgi:hypothetical protein
MLNHLDIERQDHVNGFVLADNGQQEDRRYEWYSLIM